MSANEQRIDVQNLGARRLVKRIVQAHKRVPQERSQLAACRFQLRACGRPLDHLRKVRLNLKLGMTARIHAGRISDLFPAREDRPRQFELAQLTGQGNQLVTALLSGLLHLCQTVTQRKQRGERNKSLVFENRVHSARHFGVHTHAVRTLLRWPRQQLDDVSRHVIRLGRRSPQDDAQRASR